MDITRKLYIVKILYKEYCQIKNVLGAQDHEPNWIVQNLFLVSRYDLGCFVQIFSAISSMVSKISLSVSQ